MRPIRFSGYETYFKVLTIPLIIMIFWSIIVFVVAIVGMLSSMQMAGSLTVGASLALLGSFIGMLMAIMVGFNAAKQDMRKKRDYAKMGALFGFLTSLVSGLLFAAVLVFTIFTGVKVSTGLLGASLDIMVDLLVSMHVLGPIDNTISLVIGVIGAIVYFIVAILSGALNAAIGGILTKRFT